jgi:hypothetical protein
MLLTLPHLAYITAICNKNINVTTPNFGKLLSKPILNIDVRSPRTASE